MDGEACRLWSIVGYSLWGRKESDTTEQLHFHFQEFPGGLVVRTSCFHCCSLGSVLVWELRSCKPLLLLLLSRFSHVRLGATP